MLRKQLLTAIIPVRKGSKGIPGKNLRRLGRDTLLERTIKQGKLCSYVDRTIVSTDDPEMFTIAQKYGVAAKKPRPASLATDDARTVDVVIHELEMAQIDTGYVLLLQTTSPLRKLSDIDKACQTFEGAPEGIDAIASVVRHDSPHPDKIQRLDRGLLTSYTGRSSEVARQSLPEVFALNGAIYLTHLEILKNERTFLPERTMPLLMSTERSVNLDTMMDWYLLESLINRDLVRIEEYSLDGGTC